MLEPTGSSHPNFSLQPAVSVPFLSIVAGDRQKNSEVQPQVKKQQICRAPADLNRIITCGRAPLNSTWAIPKIRVPLVDPIESHHFENNPHLAAWGACFRGRAT